MKNTFYKIKNIKASFLRMLFVFFITNANFCNAQIYVKDSTTLFIGSNSKIHYEEDESFAGIYIASGSSISNETDLYNSNIVYQSKKELKKDRKKLVYTIHNTKKASHPPVQKVKMQEEKNLQHFYSTGNIPFSIFSDNSKVLCSIFPSREYLFGKYFIAKFFYFVLEIRNATYLAVKSSFYLKNQGLSASHKVRPPPFLV